MDYLHWQLDALERILSGEKEPDSLDLQLLRLLTGNFADDRRIGKGGCGEVYKGILPNGVVIAVKKLKNTHTIDEKMFRSEVDSMIKVGHQNIVRFIGYCSETKEKALQMDGRTVMAEERERLLCFEYIRNGSLDNYLTDELRGFEWHTRYQIIKGICFGLLHLHKEKRILHMDLKPANILISDQMVPKITDFGLSRNDGISQTMSAQRLISPGYCAPEYIENGKRSWKSDIYSFGVIVTELVTGSRQMPNTNKVLRRWRHRWNKSSKHIPLWYQQVKKCLELAVRCKEKNPIKRPFIWEVVRELNELDSLDGEIRESSLEKIISSSDDMLGIEPLELHFTQAHNKEQISCSIEMTNDTDYYMAFKTATTSLLPFSIQPDKGIAAPRTKCTTTITLLAQEMTPLRHNLCMEEFIVQSTRIDRSLTAVDITDDTFNDEGDNSEEKIGDGDKVVDEVNLTVLFDTMLHEEHQKDAARSLGTSCQELELLAGLFQSDPSFTYIKPPPLSTDHEIIRFLRKEESSMPQGKEVNLRLGEQDKMAPKAVWSYITTVKMMPDQKTHLGYWKEKVVKNLRDYNESGGIMQRYFDFGHFDLGLIRTFPFHKYDGTKTNWFMYEYIPTDNWGIDLYMKRLRFRKIFERVTLSDSDYPTSPEVNMNKTAASKKHRMRGPGNLVIGEESPAWQHFIKIYDRYPQLEGSKVVYALCCRCEGVLKADTENDTRNLLVHYDGSCPRNKQPRRT